VTAGAAHACALLRDHTVMCWGSAAHGELGTVATEHVDVPVLVTGLAH